MLVIDNHRMGRENHKNATVLSIRASLFYSFLPVSVAVEIEKQNNGSNRKVSFFVFLGTGFLAYFRFTFTQTFVSSHFLTKREKEAESRNPWSYI